MINPLYSDQGKLIDAVHYSKIDLVKQYMPNVNSTWDPNAIFYFACQGRCVEIVQLLLPFCDANINNGEPLQLAVRRGNFDVVKYMLPHCDATLMRSEALQLSILHKQPDIFELLYPYSDCVVALEDVNKIIGSHRMYDPNCLVLRDRLAEIVAVQLQKECLIEAVATVPKPENPRSSRKI